jgi:hypothetical protein
MIDYGVFQFACLPEAGGTWFYQTMRSAGVPIKEVKAGGLYSNFSNGRDKLRISMVRNPCDWLFSCFEFLKKDWVERGLPECLMDMRALTNGIQDHNSFNQFLIDYLLLMPGEVSKLFLQYDADSYICAENMPWAMIEIFEMIEVRRPDTFPPATLQLTPEINDDVRNQIIKAEKEMCDAFDYY